MRIVYFYSELVSFFFPFYQIREACESRQISVHRLPAKKKIVQGTAGPTSARARDGLTDLYRGQSDTGPCCKQSYLAGMAVFGFFRGITVARFDR